VIEDSIRLQGFVPPRERPKFIEPFIRGSVEEAASEQASLSLVRPIESRFTWKRRSADEIGAERAAYNEAARQHDLFDDDLAAIEPCPFAFGLKFRDATGWHDHHCEDWETEAAFWGLSRRYGERAALAHLDREYNERRPSKGLVLAMGNMAARPQTWLLLGILVVPHAEPDLISLIH
jgi:hypothetical protein